MVRSELTSTGRAQAERIATELGSRIPTDAGVDLFSSDLRRAAQTASVIAAALGIEAVLLAGLREKSYGVAEGRPQAWLDERFVPPPPVGDRMDHREGIDGAETRGEFGRRIYDVVDTIVSRPSQHQIIVTHGFALTFVVACWIGMPLESTGSISVRASPGGITELHEDDRFHNRQIVRLDDTTHLSEAMRAGPGRGRRSGAAG